MSVPAAYPALVRARQAGPERRPVRAIARALGRLSSRWLDPKFPYRRRALRRLEPRWPGAMAARALDALFGELTERKLAAFLRAELGDPRVLDGFRAARAGGHVRARGRELVLHVTPGNVPNPSVVGVVLSLLAKSASAVKLSGRDPGLLGLYLESLRRADPGLAASVRVLGPGEDWTAWARAASLVVAYGGDRTLEAIRAKVPGGTPFQGYGHRVSAGFFTAPVLSAALAAKAALDVWMLDQGGCLSPSRFFVGRGGVMAPEVFAGTLAAALGRLSGGRAAGAERARNIELVRRRLEVRALRAAALRPLVFRAGRWAVVLDREGTLAGGEGTVVVRPFRRPEEALAAIEVLRAQGEPLQAVALEAPGTERARLAEALSRSGANRICRAGAMQNPPLSWHHDGRQALASWLEWTDLER